MSHADGQQLDSFSSVLDTSDQLLPACLAQLLFSFGLVPQLTFWRGENGASPSGFDDVEEQQERR